jgi:formiminotetrahydrofolate cyclodeaminase
MALHDTTLGSFLDTLGAKTPSPGGGAVAGLCGAVAAALAQMVVAYSEGKETLAEHANKHASAAARLSEIREQMLELAAEDERAYSTVNALQRLPQSDPAREGLPAAVREAIDVPYSVLRCAHSLLKLLEDLADKSNPYLLSDLAIAAVLAEAAASAGMWNIRVNAALAEEAGVRHEAFAAAPALLEASKLLRSRIEAACSPE